MNPPALVAANSALLGSLGVWHLVSKNKFAANGGCADAATKRNRLGHTGIPVFDELKSHVGAYTDEQGTRRYVVAHCRGHQLRDDAKISAIVGATVERVSANELASEFALQYSLVNPFYFAGRTDAIQFFDASTLVEYYPPHTMMTNLGDPMYGVEFRPSELVAAIPNARVEHFVSDSSRKPPSEYVLGILTGNSPESGLALWQHIIECIRADKDYFRGDTSFPRVVIQSVPEMGLSMELKDREKEVCEIVRSGVERLCLGGATVIGIACNTSQYFSREVRAVCREHGAEFVSMVDAATTRLRREGIHSVDLIGIGPVTDLPRWSDFASLEDHFKVEIPTEEHIDEITQLAWHVKQHPSSGHSVSKLGHLIRQATVTDTVLLALTELSIVTMQHPKVIEKSGKRFVDTLIVLGDRMAERYLEQRRAFERLRATE